MSSWRCVVLELYNYTAVKGDVRCCCVADHRADLHGILGNIQRLRVFAYAEKLTYLTKLLLHKS